MPWLGRHLPLLLYGVRLWAAVSLALWVAFSLQLQEPSWAGTSAAIVCQPVLGASLRKGWFRLVGTVIGASMSVVLTACFLQSRLGFLFALAVWCGVCAGISTLLRNFASYAAALSGYTAAIICTDELGLVGGANGNAFNLAIDRASAICIGIICAGIVLALTDFGRSRRDLASQLGALTRDVAAGLAGALTLPPLSIADSRRTRRRLHLRLVGLDALIDQASGEISDLPFRPRSLQAAVDGLSSSLSAWRSITGHLALHPEAGLAAIRRCLPADWQRDPEQLRAQLGQSVRRLLLLPDTTASGRLLIDRTAQGLLGLMAALNGLILMTVPGHIADRGPVARLRVPDLLPSVINGWRSFLVIAAATLIWIGTGWPGGATFVLFAAITVILFSPREEAAVAAARGFMLGTAATAVAAAVVAFAILPKAEGFAEFAAALALVLVPAGALSAQPWQQGMFVALEANFVPLLGPSNPMSYDIAGFYNTAMALLGGVGFGLLSFRLMPPLTPHVRARRLLRLTLRDLRRLARGARMDWDNRIYGRLAVMPDNVDLLSHARLSVALTVGDEVRLLRRLSARLGLQQALAPVLGGLGSGDAAAALHGLAALDSTLAARPPARPVLRARAASAALREALVRHADYFEQGAA